MLERNARSRDFAALAKFLMANKGAAGAAYAVKLENLGPRLAAIVTAGANGIGVENIKAAVGAMALGGSALADYSAISSGFLNSLTNASAFDDIAQDAVPVPLGTGTVGSVNSTVQAFSLGEMSMKPITKLGFSSGTVNPSKAVAAIVITRELARSALPGATALIERELRNACAFTTDAVFFSTILNGVSSNTSSGETAEAVRTDISRLLRQITTGKGSVLFVVTTPLICKVWSMLTDGKGLSAFPDLGPQGGFINKIPVLVSDGLLQGQVVVLDANGIAASTGSVALENFEHGTVVSDSAPDSPVQASTSFQSLWQLNMTAIRCERWFAGVKLRSDAVALSTNSNSYQGGNSPA